MKINFFAKCQTVTTWLIFQEIRPNNPDFLDIAKLHKARFSAKLLAALVITIAQLVL